MNEKEFLARYRAEDFDRLSLAVDAVIFGVETDLAEESVKKPDRPRLKILLVKRREHPFRGLWSLPGGFVGLNETLEDAAFRVLGVKTGLSGLYLEQLYTFGEPKRDPRTRVVSCAYLALVDKTVCSPDAPVNGDKDWFSIVFDQKSSLLTLSSGKEELALPLREERRLLGRVMEMRWLVDGPSPLAFDHAAIILSALSRIRGKADYTDLVFSLMPETFTLSHLMTVYEIILGEKLLPAAFRRKIMDKVVPTEDFVRHKKFRPGRLFRYKGADGESLNGGNL
ncbi:MAG: NUDIX hydrolase [Deltaproteobacteria bacterium]|jgi:ADP-ribose pyrophosphatase YjhB (NUDIX family)|nr:NUDIX hydrolase [Deltaproteobacteria bacterium]